jgi:predicted CoA-substrate-specific enzyme activase
MVVAGIDVGSQSTKVVILEGDRILTAVILQTRQSSESEARQAMDEALRRAGLAPDDIRGTVATGAGRKSVPFAQQQRTSVNCLARAAHFLYPQVRTVVDAGAESSTAIRLSADGTIADTASNDKCAGGSGTFLENMGRMLRIPLAEMGAESLKATHAEAVSATCAVFAESEVISLVHGTPPVPIANVLAGIHESTVDRLFALAQRAGVQSEVLMTGGVSRNIGVVRAMEARLGKPVLVPEDPQIVGALGAALFASQGAA